MPSCIVCFCVYNNEEGLPYCLRNVVQLKPLFDSLKIIVLYDHSEDKSLQILIDFKKQKLIDIAIFVNMGTKSLERQSNIANARNFLLKLIREKFSTVDYFITMDTNRYACVGDIRISTLEYALKNNEEWDALSFDREAGYYDYWALSFHPFVYSMLHFDKNSDKMANLVQTCFKDILNFYKTTKPNELIPVYSSFNGFAIYKTDKFLNCFYAGDIDINLFPYDTIANQIKITGLIPSNILSGDCEHRRFHLEAIQKNNAKIRVSTQFLFSKDKSDLE